MTLEFFLTTLTMYVGDGLWLREENTNNHISFSQQVMHSSNNGELFSIKFLLLTPNDL